MSKRLRRSVVIGGTAGAVIAAAGIAFAVTVLGGSFTGTIQSNGQQPEVIWTSPSSAGTVQAPTLVACHTSDGSVDTSASATASTNAAGTDVTLSMSNVYANETCTFEGYLDDITTADTVTISGITLTSSSASITSSMQVLLNGLWKSPPFTLPQTSGPVLEVQFTVTVPAAATAGSYSINGGVQMAAAS